MSLTAVGTPKSMLSNFAIKPTRVPGHCFDSISQRTKEPKKSWWASGAGAAVAAATAPAA